MTVAKLPAQRKLPHFVEGFQRYMANMGSPPLYTKWTGIFILSAVVERKVWLNTVKKTLYPNQYITLVGPAGIGKSVCTNEAHDLIDDVRSVQRMLHIAPTSVSRASLIDALYEAERSIMRVGHNPPMIRFNSLIAIPNELGVFLPSWEGDFMNTLTDLWDCKRYVEKKRTKSLSIEIPATQLNMLSATTPSYLNSLLPEGAWEHGFMSRMICVYSGEVIYGDIFGDLFSDVDLRKSLVHDLSQVYDLFGEFTITEEAKEALNLWSRSGGAPAPDHPKLSSYITRRVAHVLKLCMVSSIAWSNDLTISIENFVEALDWLTEMERFLPDIFKSMKTGGSAEAMDELYHFVYKEFIRNKEGVPEHLIHAFLSERVPIHNVEPIINAMLKAQILQKKFGAGMNQIYEPVPRRAA